MTIPKLPITFNWHLYHEKTYFWPFVYLGAITLLYFGTFLLLVVTQSIWLKCGCGVLCSFAAGQLFVIGHDACHNSFTPSARLNRFFGTLSLALSFHVYSLWEFGHNKIHHPFTNLRTKDFVWRPLSLEEYRSLSLPRRALQRIYRARSSIGFPLYYLLEILLPRMVFPSRGIFRRRFVVWDVAVFYAVWTVLFTVLVFGEYMAQGNISLSAMVINLMAGFVGPLIYVCWAIGFVVYFNHTHPSIPWHESPRTWNYWEAQQHCTLHLTFSSLTRFLLPSEVMNHVVHHLDTRIPVRHLGKAQEAFNRLHKVKTVVWTPALHADILSRCKLYDYAASQWLDFDGNVTGPSDLECRGVSA